MENVEKKEIKEVWIPAINIGSLKAKMAKLMAKAQKVGSFLHFAITDETQILKHKNDDGTTECVEMRLVEVAGDRPRFNGWIFVATIEPLENNDCLVKAVPGFEVPPHYRKNGLDCDHCQSPRMRNEVYLVMHQETGELKQVGSSCLKDFLGHKDPATLVQSYFHLLNAVWLTMSEFSEFGGFGKGQCAYDIIEFLSYVHDEARKYGWVSATRSKDECILSTACGALDHVNGYSLRYNAEEHYEPSSEAFAFAEAALAWVRSLDKNNASDYMYNLILSCNREVVDSRTFSIVASLYATYAKHVERELAAQREKMESNFVGEIKKRQEMTVTLLRMTPIDSYFGTNYMHRFVDEKGNIVVWFASNASDFEVGKTYTVKATPKKHEIYNDVKQTTVARLAA